MMGLASWCKRYTYGYPGVEIKDITWSFQDGLAFLAMLHNFHPDKVGDFRRFKTDTYEDKLHNLETAFTIGETVGIDRLLEASDILDYGQPEKKSMATYISCYPKEFSELEPKYPAGIMTKEEHFALKAQKEKEFMQKFRDSQKSGGRGGNQLSSIFNKRRSNNDQEDSEPSPQKKQPVVPRSSGRMKNLFQQQEEEKKAKMAKLMALSSKKEPAQDNIKIQQRNKEEEIQREEEQKRLAKIKQMEADRVKQKQLQKQEAGRKEAAMKERIRKRMAEEKLKFQQQQAEKLKLQQQQAKKPVENKPKTPEPAPKSLEPIKKEEVKKVIHKDPVVANKSSVPPSASQDIARESPATPPSARVPKKLVKMNPFKQKELERKRRMAALLSKK